MDTRVKTPLELRYVIDGLTPETLPMARLADYVREWAVLLGETSHVHFDRVSNGSAVLVAKIEPQAFPKLNSSDYISMRGCNLSIQGDTLDDIAGCFLDYRPRQAPRQRAWSQRLPNDGELLNIGAPPGEAVEYRPRRGHNSCADDTPTVPAQHHELRHFRPSTERKSPARVAAVKLSGSFDESFLQARSLFAF
jgi:hypothetical protein